VRKILGCKSEKVTEDWSKLHNEELHALHSSPNIIQVIKSRTRAGHVARMADSRHAYSIVVEKPEGRPLRIPRYR
jgi:hypothetical protein